MGCCPSCLVNGQIVVHKSQFFSNGAAATPSEVGAVHRSRSCRSRRRGTKTQIRGQGFSNSLGSDPSESELGCLLWASPRVGAGPADCLGGGAATWAPPSTRRSSQESDVTSIDVAGHVTGGCRRRTTRKVLVDAQARACAVAGAGLRATPIFSGCCPGFKTKIGGFARPTCRKFGGDLPRHRRDVLRLRCEGMGLRATSERRDLVSAAEQAGGARCEATTSGGRGVRTASAVTVAISFVPLPLPPSAVVDDGQINILTPMGGPRRRR